MTRWLPVLVLVALVATPAARAADRCPAPPPLHRVAMVTGDERGPNPWLGATFGAGIPAVFLHALIIGHHASQATAERDPEDDDMGWGAMIGGLFTFIAGGGAIALTVWTILFAIRAGLWQDRVPGFARAGPAQRPAPTVTWGPDGLALHF